MEGLAVERSEQEIRHMVLNMIFERRRMGEELGSDEELIARCERLAKYVVNGPEKSTGDGKRPSFTEAVGKLQANVETAKAMAEERRRERENQPAENGGSCPRPKTGSSKRETGRAFSDAFWAAIEATETPDEMIAGMKRDPAIRSWEIEASLKGRQITHALANALVEVWKQADGLRSAAVEREADIQGRLALLPQFVMNGTIPVLEAE